MKRIRRVPRPIPKAVERSFYSNLLQMNRARAREIKEKIVPILKLLSQSEAGGTGVYESLFNEFEEEMEALKEKWSSAAVKEHANQLAIFVVKSCMNSIEKQEYIAKVEPLHLSDAHRERKQVIRNVNLVKSGIRLLPATNQIYKEGIGINMFLNNEKILAVMQGQISAASSLITTLGNNELTAIKERLSQQIAAGTTYKQTYNTLVNQLGVTRKRAKLISVDQTSKVYGGILKHQQESAGFKFFRWKTANDQRVRHWHMKLSKKETKYGTGVYRWDQLPWDEKHKNRIFPTSEIRCRCYPIPVLESSIGKKSSPKKRN